jgi:hypothetical protein
MSGEIKLASEFSSVNGALIVSDLNEAQRRYFLARSLIFLPKVISAATAVNTSSVALQLPGRNKFVVQVVASSGTPTLGVKLQGSLIGDVSEVHDSANWTTIGSEITTVSITSLSDNSPYVLYRVVTSAAVGSSASVTVHFAAIQE